MVFVGQHIVVCQNSASSESIVRGVLLHEIMIHMFDYCQNKLDVKNIDHLACTEIRAANLAHSKAKMSVMAVHKVSEEIAEAAIERVLTKGYNDLEPVGRRIRRNSLDMPRAYAEGHLYGYKM
ncbi:Mitochondrial inner membrane protease ATP23 [Temnothorax longispinosus]|uniref:Mitochondrial inner membrane protease ATP23 n=1 Tax=Temnothorax longispinosus TaxID=300112 RepID=A0A4S2JQL5_9HYME|nr:Mitochondrial inner membrane protease ATP23 [Temnothorax longispinosus]